MAWPFFWLSNVRVLTDVAVRRRADALVSASNNWPFQKRMLQSQNEMVCVVR